MVCIVGKGLTSLQDCEWIVQFLLEQLQKRSNYRPAMPHFFIRKIIQKTILDWYPLLRFFSPGLPCVEIRSQCLNQFHFFPFFMVWPLPLVIVGKRTRWYVCQGFRWNTNNGPIIWGNAFHVCYFGWFQYATSRNKHRNCLNNWLQSSYLQWPENCFLKWQQAIFLYGKNTITDGGSNVLKLFKLLILFKLFYTA